MEHILMHLLHASSLGTRKTFKWVWNWL